MRVSRVAPFAVVGIAVTLVALTDFSNASADPAPNLQLPWPTGTAHRIGVGHGYDCYTHDRQTQTISWNADYYALDFEVGFGDPVTAVADGIVANSIDTGDGYGTKVVIDHGGGYYSLVGHLNNVASGIQQGAPVSQGDVIGYADDTGLSFGTHLHFHMQKGTSAYKPEPMSRVTGFEQYGDCAGSSSPYWTSWPPYATIEGALVAGSGPEVYIISGGLKRWITTRNVFDTCGYRWNEILKLPGSAVNMMPTGPNVSTGPPCPQTLAAVPGTNPVYTVFNYTKRWVSSSTVFNGCKYDWGDIVGVSEGALDNYYTAGPIYGPPCPYVRDPWYNEALIEGSLVASGNPVYVIAGGQKRHIVSPQVRDACGYKTNDVISVSSTVANLIPTGPDITGPPCPYTLITGSGPEVYVMLSQVKRHVSSRPAFDACGYVWGEIVQLSDAQVNSVPTSGSLDAPPCPFTRQ